MKTKICVLQFKRAGKFKKNMEKVREFLEEAKKPDFALIGGEFALNESLRDDTYSPFMELATSFDCNIVAPINANLIRFPDLRKKRSKGYSSMHIFNREGALAVISKNLLHVQLEFISQFGPVWMLIAYLGAREGCKKSKICDNPLFWSIAIISSS